VPSRLINETLRVHLFERRLEVFYGGQPHLTIDRLPGRNGHSINYRDIIWSLVQKPGAFARYRYREALFPTLVFRRAYDAIVDAGGASVKSDLAYLRILHLAAATMEIEIETAIEQLLRDGVAPHVDRVRAMLKPVEVDVPLLNAPVVDLGSYDSLLASGDIA
jgi:hypothetical protein